MSSRWQKSTVVPNQDNHQTLYSSCEKIFPGQKEVEQQWSLSVCLLFTNASLHYTKNSQVFIHNYCSIFSEYAFLNVGETYFRVLHFTVPHLLLLSRTPPNLSFWDLQIDYNCILGWKLLFLIISWTLSWVWIQLPTDSLFLVNLFA